MPVYGVSFRIVLVGVFSCEYKVAIYKQETIMMSKVYKDQEKNVYGNNDELFVRLTRFSFLFTDCDGTNNSGPATMGSVVKTYFSALNNNEQRTNK